MDLAHIIKTQIELFPTWLGYIISFLIIFAESGLFFGFFLPGDSFLFILGVLSNTKFNIFIMIGICILGAILGDSIGYWTGKKYGKKLFIRLSNSNNRVFKYLFKKERLEMAEKYYKKHGGITIILARFIPAVRTFVPIVAGISEMHYSTFIKYNVIGGITWVVTMTTLGYFLGQVIGEENIDKFILPIVIVILIISIGMGVLESKKMKAISH